MRNLVFFVSISLFCANALAELSVADLRHACNQLVEQEKSWLGNLTTSKEEAFLAGRCEGAIKAVVEDSSGCYLSKGQLIKAAIRVTQSSYSRSVPDHIRAKLGCRD
ncbi:hypothetical protein [Spongorhabdus nitratireducens]